MGTSAGPSLAGIGRGGESNLVLEMDAHDAKSYPGEPTSNIFYNPNNWTGSDWTQTNGTIANNAAEGPNGGSAGSITATNGDPYIYSNLVHSVATGGLTFSCWVKGVGSSVGKSGDIRINFSGTATGSATTVDYTLTGLWQRVSISGTVTGAGTIKVGLEPPNSAAVGDVVYLADAQLEQKGYATPFVREGNGGTGTYNARPASVNLMIHGDVGSGQTFSDSSPSKHTITAGGDVTHSNTQSKFSGGSIYFDSDGDYLSIPDSADWDFGNGDFTIDFWLGSPTDTGLWAEVIGQGWTSGSDSWVIGIDWQNNNKMRLAYTTNGSTDIYGAYTSVISTSGWTHYAFVRSGTTLTNYVNGVADGTHTIGTSTIYSSNKPLYIGQRQTSVGSFDYVGYMDEVRITKGTALWTAAFTPPTRRNLSAPVADRSGNHNGINLINGTDSGGATYRAGEVIEPVATAVLDFDGTDDYAIAGDSDDWNFGTEPFAIEQWLYFTDFSPSGDNWTSALQQYASEGDRNGWMVFYSNVLEWRLECTAASPAFYPGNIVTGCSLNTWYLFTISREGSIFKQYINGVLRQTDTSNPTFDNIAGPMYIGNYSASDPHEFQGKMGALRIYKGGALSDEQVKENFNQQSSRFNVLNWANNAIVQNGLDLWLDAGDRGSYPGTGSTWYDLTSNNYNGTIANAVYNGGYGNGSFTFDGSGDTVDVGPISTAGDHSNCTISVWMNKSAQVANYGNVYDCNYGVTTYNKGPRMEVDIAGSIVRVYMGSDGGNYVSISFGSLSNDEWYNLVLTVTPNGSSQDLKSYTDGALVSSYTSSSTYVWDGDVADLYLGVGFTAGRHFTGKIAAFELYNRVLSANEIAQNFTVQRQRFLK